MLSLVYSLTSGHVSVHLWQVFQMLHTMFQKDGIDYFTEMMPALHNYITVDTPAFLANPEHVQIIYNMCKTVMSADIGEDAECHAAKLLEVIILQCPGQVDHVIPSFIELALSRLTREVLTSELRTMCLQVVIAALYYNLPFLMDTLSKLQIPNVNGSLLAQFLKSWFHDIDCFVGLHDRKITVLGLCSLVNLISNNRPNEVSEVSAQIIPALLLLFSGLKRAYAAKAKEDEDSSDEEDEDDDEEKDENELASDEDEVDEDGAQYLEKLEKSANEDDDSDNEYSDDGMEETALESYQTPLDEDSCQVDEYQVFKNVLQSIQTADPVWYQALMTPVTPEQTKELEDVFKLAEQRHAAAESKRIEDAGGYVFQNQSVPQNFNFGT
ncbi:Hypothetical predicted protein [Mytilus galloprovincialis]|nr:Hypothetical predicted protein [Mytilus galloprovincialis]